MLNLKDLSKMFFFATFCTNLCLLYEVREVTSHKKKKNFNVRLICFWYALGGRKFTRVEDVWSVTKGSQKKKIRISSKKGGSAVKPKGGGTY